MNAKRNDLSLCYNLKILEQIKSRKTQIEIAKEFQISQLLSFKYESQCAKHSRRMEKIET